MVVVVRELVLPFGCSLAAGARGERGIWDSFLLDCPFISHLKVTGLYTWAGFPGCVSPVDPGRRCGGGIPFPISHGICGVSPSHGKSLVIFALCRSQFGAWTLPRGIKVTLELLGAELRAGREWEFLGNPGITGV